MVPFRFHSCAGLGHDAQTRNLESMEVQEAVDSIGPS